MITEYFYIIYLMEKSVYAYLILFKKNLLYFHRQTKKFLNVPNEINKK